MKPKQLCILTLMYNILQLLKSYNVDLNRYPFLLPLPNRFGHLVPLTTYAYNVLNTKFFERVGWVRMNTQDRRRGAASAGATSNLDKDEVSSLLRHSPKTGDTRRRYIILPDGFKVRLPCIIAYDAKKTLLKKLKKFPALIELFIRAGNELYPH